MRAFPLCMLDQEKGRNTTMKYVLICQNDDNSMYWDAVKDDIKYLDAFILEHPESEKYTDAYDLIKAYNYYYDPDDESYTLYDFIKDFAPGEYLPGALYRWEKMKKALEYSSYCGITPEAITQVLSALTGEKWEYYTLRGCCQGDMAHLICKAGTIGEDYVCYIEAVYFNTGAEICVLDDDGEPPKSEMEFYEHGYFDYTLDVCIDDIAKLIGADENNIKLYELKPYTGYRMEAV